MRGPALDLAPSGVEPAPHALDLGSELAIEDLESLPNVETVDHAGVPDLCLQEPPPAKRSSAAALFGRALPTFYASMTVMETSA